MTINCRDETLVISGAIRQFDNIMTSRISFSPPGAALFALQREVERSRPGAGSPVSPGRLSILRGIDQQGPSTASQLARIRGASRQGTQRIVDDLLQAGWLHPKPNPRHRSAPLLALTEQGAEVYQALRDAETQSLNDLAEGLDPAALQAARRLLAELRRRAR